MEELKEMILNEVVAPVTEDDKKEETFINDKLPKKPKNNFKNNGFKEKICNVISYDKHKKLLDVKFDKYGIRIKDVGDFDGDTVTIKYKGEIGKSDFEYKL